ncbi:MAG: nuclear transport factor 2 family protein [Bdellovibrionales bacterium]|nr:nuclear transport factor 2 family protein [Bdellovibrionales bacterium]
MFVKSLVLAILFASVSTAVAENHNTKGDSTMEAIVVVKNYFKYLQQGEFEKLGQLFDDNIVWHQPGKGSLSGVYKGKPDLFALFGEFMTRSEGTFKIDKVHKIMINGSNVVAHLHFSAQKGSHSISMEGVDLMKVENGKIVEVHLFSGDQSSEDKFWDL